MIVKDFTVRGRQRFDELQDFINTQKLNASFLCPPIYDPDTDIYKVSLKYNSDLALKIDELYNKWQLEDKKLMLKKTRSKFVHSFTRFSFSSS